MRFHQPEAEIYIPDGTPEPEALSRTTHLCFSAHQDDIEIMAAHAILACFQQPEQWFTGVVVTDGRGSPRNGLYAHYTDEAMRAVRFQEQRKAAFVGEYAAQIMLDYPSKAVKDPTNPLATEDMVAILRATRPREVYTHNLADKHDTHVAVALRVIQAIRQLPASERPERLYGGEVWRDLDWMPDEDKVVFDLSQQENLQAALLGVFDSQISGGKRYDLATLARRRVNATFFASHAVDQATALAFSMDLTPLIRDDSLDPLTYTTDFIARFREEVTRRIRQLQPRTTA
ncbi:MAG: PIG-L family deacetylase [Chloroflexi bacterium]|nr:PIG-L family deacetylase [Chloroflexota bacterium]